MSTESLSESPSDSNLYITREEIEEACRRDGRCEVTLGHVNSNDGKFYEPSVAQIGANADSLLRAFDIDPARWGDQLTGIYDGWTDRSSVDADVLSRIRKASVPLGKLLHERAYDALAIESGEEDDASVGVLLALNDVLKVDFQGIGHNWLDDDDEVGYEIKFYGAVTPIRPVSNPGIAEE